MRNNPIRYNDPSGHRDSGECGPGEDCDESDEERAKADRNALLNLLKNNEKNGCKYGNCERGLEIAVFTVISLTSVSAITTAVSEMASMIPVVKTAAEAGSAAETVNIACGRDCSDEAQQLKQSTQGMLPSISNTLTQVGDDVVSSTQQSYSNVLKVANDLENWLGNDIVSIRNQAGDFILRNGDNTKRFRFDFFNTSPHQNPHMHLEWVNKAGEWISKRIFPFDVIPK